MNNNTAQNGQSTKARKKAANAAQARRAKTNLQTANSATSCRTKNASTSTRAKTTKAKSGTQLLVRNANTAPAYWMHDALWFILADGKDTGGRFSMMEQLVPKGSGPGPHKHTWSDETFYMLDGEITLLVGDEIFTARKGDFVMVPRDTRHGFRVDSETARFLNGYTPASMEAEIIELGTPATERILPPNGTVSPREMNPALLQRYGLEFLPGPDPLRPKPK